MSYADEVLADAPAWYLRFLETVGSFTDSSPNAEPVSESGAHTRGLTGPVVAGGKAMTTHSGDYLTTTQYTATSLSAASIECWIRTTATGTIVIEQNRGGPGQNGVCLQLCLGSTGGFGAGAGQLTAFFNATSYWLGIHTTGTYNDGEWHHVVATWTGGGTISTGQLAIYVDGELAATAADSGNTGTRSAPASGQLDMTLFNGGGAVIGGSHAEIDVAEVAFYPSALSAGRVLAHYEAASVESDVPAVGWDVYRIVPPGDSIEFLTTLDDATNKAIRPVRNEPGSGQLALNKNSPNATADILAPGNLVKVRIPEIHSDHIFSWFLEQGDFTLVSPDEKGGEDFTFGGRGGMSYWERAIWLSTSFVVPWWPDDVDDPPAGAIGLLRVEAGRYAFYDVDTISGHLRITDQDFVTVGAFDAYYDRRKTLLWPVSEGGPGGFKRHLVHFMAGEPHDTRWMHPSQDGVTDIRATYAIGDSILLSDISPDTPGAILYRMFQEGQAADRPTHPIPLMTIDFTATHDSNGDPWNTTDALAGLTAELGETYLATIVKLLSTGVIDVEMGPDLDFHAYNGQGRDLTGTTFGAGKVRFVKGVNIVDELRRERDDNPVGTFIEVVGLENSIGRAVLPDAASRVAREVAATGDSDDETVLEALGLATLNARLIRSDAIGLAIAVGDDEDTGRYLPGPEGSDHGHFWLGDIITLHTGEGEQDFDQEDERVFAITIAEDDAGNLDVTPEVGSVLGEAERRLYANESARAASFQTRSQFSDTEAAEQAVVVVSDVHESPALSALLPARTTPSGSGFLTADPQGAIVDDDATTYKSAGTLAHYGGVIHRVFSVGSMHNGSDQVVKHTKSYDYGATWTTPVTIATPASGGHNIAGAAIVALRSGRLLVSMNDTNDSDVYDVRLQVIYSDDGGETWSSQYTVPEDILTGEQAGTCNPIELPNGDILIPAFGDTGTDADFRAGVYRSTDGGLTFPSFQLIHYGNGVIEPNETCLVWVDGELLAFMRSEITGHTHRAVSTDYGFTWSAPTDVNTMTGRPLVAEVWPGVLVMFGRNNVTDQHRRWSVSWDKGVTWETPAEVDAGDTRVAGYAALLTLAPGHLLVFYSQEVGSTKTIIYQRYYVDGYGVDVLGNVTAAGLSAPVGGGLSGSLPNPTVVDDGHSHTAATLPAGSSSTGGDHVHVVDEVFSGDASTTVFILANEAAPDSVMAWVDGVRTPVTLGGTFNDEITFGSAPGSGTDNVSVDYAAVLT